MSCIKTKSHTVPNFECKHFLIQVTEYSGGHVLNQLARIKDGIFMREPMKLCDVCKSMTVNEQDYTETLVMSKQTCSCLKHQTYTNT